MDPRKIKKILDTPFWLETLEVDTAYTRVHDDHDGTFTGRVNVNVGRDGDLWMICDPPEGNIWRSLRFRAGLGGGQSPRVRNALLILAEAIRLDNADNPQQLPPRPAPGQEPPAGG